MSSVLGEHISYLALPGRFELFDKAISARLKRNDTVADLGCGVGVLGLQCLEHGASHVYGIDSSDAIYVAREAVERAGLSGRYTTIPDMTFRVSLPDPVDLLICDHVGYFGFDYGIIELLRDAAARFLKPGGAIIPDILTLQIAGVRSQTLHERASEWTNDYVPQELRWLDSHARNTKYSHSFEQDELCTPAATLGSITLGTEGDDLFRFSATLKIESDGLFDGLAGWFDVHLGGGVWMTNSPIEDRSIKRAQAFLPTAEPFTVSAGDEVEVTLRFTYDNSAMAWTVSPPGDAKPQRMSTFHGEILTPADLIKDTARPLRLSRSGEARAYVLSLIDGKKSGEDIISQALRERPDLMPSELAIRDFIKAVLASGCEV